MKKIIVKPELIAALSNFYIPRIVPLNSSQCKGMIYQGIVYRVDDGYDGLGMLHFFTKGFSQRPVPPEELNFDNFLGVKFNGGTGRVGISTTTSFELAFYYNKIHGGNGSNIYVIDLSEHRFTLDIHWSALAYNLPIDSTLLREVNVANSIHAEMIYGHYCVPKRRLTLNPNYEPGLIDHIDDILKCPPKPALIHPILKTKMNI